MDYQIELQQSGITVSDFLAYVKCQCEENSIPFDLTCTQFTKPHSEYSNSYYVTDGKIKYYNSGNATYIDSNGSELSKRVYREYYDDNAEGIPCKVKTVRQFAYDHQIYVLNFDGSYYNEICGFIFENDSLGTGYYFQANRDRQTDYWH